ncbi:NAD(P)/FAD-dependent oxidoreductase [Amphritea balenae]|uniref:FAD-binding oxidoreductase n=1 Tax=Amphritea balenae TaxID=452629 RepID=A0A3P1ST79_9GAMM|nr:FAD-dependent oxidoreductase [Amphritea balenae]RRC99382.1 FAD-binding oxidoreductase [Amphritea balenae]GGK71592.1 amino acid dehydrogenase [Amphritea balenae]
METENIVIIGAGIVGLSTALSLQKSGYQVTLIDREDPGMGASFGNAGLFADYARLPFTKFAMLRKMPGMLLDSTSPLSMQSSYLPNLVTYGLGFVKSCLPSKYEQGRAALSALQNCAVAADQRLLQLTGSEDLIKAKGCLALFDSEQAIEDARVGDMAERIQQGVSLEFLSAGEVADLEPDLSAFHAGGVFYPNTRFTVSPVALSQRYAEHFVAQGGNIVLDEVLEISPQGPGVRVRCSGSVSQFDKLVLCAGVASKKLLKPMGCNFPLVSERGYHLTLDTDGKKLSRPVGWLDKAVFLTPMSDGVRLAGTAEFAYADAPLNPERASVMLQHAKVMLGQEPEIRSTWVGSRPSTPDSLPVIGMLKQYPQISVAFGHGHLGLTFGAITGQLISECIRGVQTSVDLTPFAPERFS